MKQAGWRNVAVIGALLCGASCNHKYTGDDVFTPSGAVTTVVTDAAADQIASFSVTVTALTLTKQSGATVSVLDTPVRVDLADLADQSALLSNASVTAGQYIGANITFDLSTAVVQIVGQSGSAAIEDLEGNALTGNVTLPIQFAAPITVATTTHSLLELDVDLNQSCVVDASGNAVLLEPALVVRVDPAQPKPIALFGTLLSVESTASTFHMRVETPDGTALQDVVIDTDSTTVFHVDGVPSSGATGLAALAVLSAGAGVQVFGAIDSTTSHFDANQVEAGAGTFFGGTDIVEGFVTGRIGGAGANATFTVLGQSQNAAHDTFQFDQSFVVSTSFASTKVVATGSSTALDLDAVNIGQKVRVYGVLAGTAVDATATDAVIRVQPTDVIGHANAAPSGSTLLLTVDHVGFRDVGDFTWSEGGTTPPDPDALVAAIGSLGSGLSITTNTPVVARGTFTGVAASGADFTATSLANSALAPSLLFVRNRPLVGLTVTPTATSSTLDLAISGSIATGESATVDVGLHGVIALPPSPTPNVTGAGSSGVYTLRDLGAGTFRVFTTYASFLTALESALAGGGTLIQLGATGVWTSATSNLAATSASAVVL